MRNQNYYGKTTGKPMKKSILSLLVGLSVVSQAFADDLYQVYQQAMVKDPTINRAEAERNSAYEGISISRAALLPDISGTISYSDATNEFARATDTGTLQVVSQDSTTLAMGLNLSMSLYDHSNWVAMDRAEKVAQQSDTSFAVSKQDLIVRTTQAYLSILRAMDSLEFAQAEKRAIERQLEQTKQRFEVGLTAITDVHEAQANFDNTVSQVILAENQVELRREELREITGKYHDDISVLNTERFSAVRPEPAKVEDWLSIADEKSLDLMVRRLAKDIAKDDIDSAKAGHYPTLGLSASMSRDDQETTFGGTTSNLPITNSNSIGLSLSIPIYQGGSVTARTAQARYNYVAVSEDLELAHRSTVRSVRSSYNAVNATIAGIRALEQSVVSAESALKATEAGFDVGTRTIVDVLDSTRNLYNAKSNLAGARYDFINSVLTLKRAAGSLTESDIISINKGLIAQQ
jgi:outer membrane protein